MIPPGYAADLRRALSDIADRTNARLRFIGYTKNERLDRRTASVYGDDIGLSAARARRAMEAVMQDPLLSGAQSEHEGRGYVQSDDVVNAGFIQGEDSRSCACRSSTTNRCRCDDYEGVDITRITRELKPEEPLRAQSDAHHRGRQADRRPGPQLCRHPALHRRRSRPGRHPVPFDNLESRPRLGVAAHPVAVAVTDQGDAAAASPVQFPDVRQLCELHRARRDPDLRPAASPCRPSRSPSSRRSTRDSRSGSRRADGSRGRPANSSYVLRAYDAKGNFDETDAQPLWLYRETSSAEADGARR